MDQDAVWNCSEEELQKLGLHEKGHTVSLKSFCMPDNSTKKEELVQYIKGNGRERINHIKKRKGNGGMKTIMLGWMDYKKEKGRFISVRDSRGGGSRTLTVPNETTLLDLLTTAIKLFLPNGNTDELNLYIGNSKGEQIEEEEFPLNAYILRHKFTRTRLYLLTKRKGLLGVIQSKMSKSFENSDDDDFGDFQAPFT